jgi:putative tryptophan/tyrosine transport system substrate-binding protein
MLNEHVEAINVLASPRLFSWRAVIMERLATAAVPAIYQFPEMAEEGGLMGYGGENVGDIPIERPTKFDFCINRSTAKVMGIEFPQRCLQLPMR